MYLLMGITGRPGPVDVATRDRGAGQRRDLLDQQAGIRVGTWPVLALGLGQTCKQSAFKQTRRCSRNIRHMLQNKARKNSSSTHSRRNEREFLDSRIKLLMSPACPQTYVKKHETRRFAYTVRIGCRRSQRGAMWVLTLNCTLKMY